MTQYLYEFLFTKSLSPSGLAQATTTTKFKLGNISFMINGEAYYLAAADNIADPAGSTAAAQHRVILISLSVAGAVVQTLGPICATAAEAEARLVAAPADHCPIGYLLLGASFTAGTTDVTAGHCKTLGLLHYDRLFPLMR